MVFDALVDASESSSDEERITTAGSRLLAIVVKRGCRRELGVGVYIGVWVGVG